MPRVRRAEAEHAEEWQRTEVGMLRARAAIGGEDGLEACGGSGAQELFQRGPVDLRVDRARLPWCWNPLSEVVCPEDLRQEEGAQEELLQSAETRTWRLPVQGVVDHLIRQPNMLELLRGRPLAVGERLTPAVGGDAAGGRDARLDRGLMFGNGSLPLR